MSDPKPLFKSAKDETIRMFDSKGLEFFTRVHPIVPHALYWPVVAYLVYLSVKAGASGLQIGLLLPAGVIFWTVSEYLLHRFFFHLHMENRLWKTIHFYIHGIHHDYPSDSKRLVMPPIASIPLAITFYFAIWGAFRLFTPSPFPRAWLFFAGFVIGYIIYDTIHYATHHLSWNNPTFVALKQFHLKHHFKDDTSRYGITSPFWDLVFATFKENKR